MPGSVSPGAFIGDKRDWLKVNGDVNHEEDCYQSDYDVDDVSFGLPLKSRHLEGNFDDILHISDAKKVRFVEGKSAMTVEQLLENTSNLNLFVEKNMERINGLRSGLDVQEWYRSSTPDTPTGTNISAKATASASAGSTSNFQLSEAGDRDSSTIGGIYSVQDSNQESNMLDSRLSNLLASTSAADYSLQKMDSSTYNESASNSHPNLDRTDDQRDNTLPIHSLLRTNSEETGLSGLHMTSKEASHVFIDILQLAFRLSLQKEQNEHNNSDIENDNDDDNTTINNNDNNNNNTTNNNNNDDDENDDNNNIDNNIIKDTSITTDNKDDTDITHITQNAEHPSDESLDSGLSPKLESIFQMKSTPTLSASDYIDRIESKCSFAPVIYLTASFLLITYCNLQFDDQNGFHIEQRITESMMHRLTIACIRVAAKLLEDTVHSHHYFSKVCGVSKKLLSKLELQLLLSLQSKPGGLIVTEQSIQTVMNIHSHIEKSC